MMTKIEDKQIAAQSDWNDVGFPECSVRVAYVFRSTETIGICKRGRLYVRFHDGATFDTIDRASFLRYYSPLAK